MPPYQPQMPTGLPPPFSDSVFEARQPTLQLIYDTAPTVVRDGVESGVRAAMRSTS